MTTYDSIHINPDALALLRVSQGLVDKNQPEQALALVSQCSTRDSVPMRNARGVCLLHLNRYEDAFAIFRELNYPNDVLNVPQDTPTEVRVNYVSSMLMMGKIQIAASMLYHIPDQEHLAVKRLRAGIRAWKRALPWWGRVLLPIGMYPESAPRLGRHVGRFWFPPTRQAPAPRKKAA